MSDATLPKAESLFWLSIGVLFLSSSFYLALHFSHYELAGLALAGIFFGAQPRWTQLFFYMAIATALVLLGRCIFGSTPFFWTFGLLLSILSGWFTLSFAGDWALTVEEPQQQKAAPVLDDGLREALDEKVAACEKLQKECVAIRQTVAAIAQEKDQLQKRLEERTLVWDRLQETAVLQSQERNILERQLEERIATCDKLQQERELLEERVAAVDHLQQTIALYSQEKSLLQKELEAKALQHEELQKDHARLQLNMSAESLEISFIRSEKEALQKELDRARSEEGLKQQNEQLFKELNAARSAQEQTQLINETLTRLYAAEKQVNEELRQKSVEVAENLDLIQLRRQFEDRRVVLHQTRSELFHTDTERQTLLRERDEPFYDAGQDRFLVAIEGEVKRLEEENRLLEEIVTTATARPVNKVEAWLELRGRPKGL